MGPGPWEEELVVDGSVGVVAVVVIVGPVSVGVSSLEVVVSVTGADVGLEGGGLVLPGSGRSPQFT